jgi:hypothetical protein
MLASDFGFRISTSRRDLDFPVRFEVRHVVLHIVQGGACGQTAPVHALIERAQNDVLRFRCIDDSSEQLVELGLVRDDRVAPKTKSARFAKENQTEAFHVDHERKFPNIGSRFAPCASREASVGVRIQDERISRGQGAHPIVPICSSSHVRHLKPVISSASFGLSR